MPPRVRRFVLTAHVASSVGWLGAVAAFLALAIAGLTAQDAQVVRAVYLAMDAIGWFVLVPLSLASLLTGVVQSLAGKWGLFWHYWVVVKLAINIVATIILLLYMETLSNLAGLAEAGANSHVGALRSPSPALHAGAALLLLLVATTLSVYKPPGMTRYGQRKQQQRRAARRPAPGP